MDDWPGLAGFGGRFSSPAELLRSRKCEKAEGRQGGVGRWGMGKPSRSSLVKRRFFLFLFYPRENGLFYPRHDLDSKEKIYLHK